MIEQFNNILRFLIKPQYEKGNEFSFNKILKVYLIAYISIFLVSFFSNFLINILSFFSNDNPLKNLQINEQNILKKFGLFALVGILLFMPFVEELMFRLSLKQTKFNIYISLFLMVSFIILNFITTKSTSSQILFFILCGLNIVNFLLNKRFKLMYYFSALIFGLIHITNLSPLNLNLTPIYLALVLPQIYAGLMFGYIRIKFNIYYAIIFHIIFNIPHIIVLLLKN